MDEQFSFLTYFSNHNLIHQLVNGQIANELKNELHEAGLYRDNLKAHYENAAYNSSIVRYLMTHDVPSLQKLLVGNKGIKAGTFFWVETTFIFKGASTAFQNYYDKGIKPSYFSFRIDFKEFANINIKGELNIEHLYTTSATGQLSGKKTKFMVGYVQTVEGTDVIVRAVLIGDRVLSDDSFVLYDTHKSHLTVEKIDEFSNIKSVKFNDPFLDLERNRNIPEATIKKWLSEIINESDVDKDWGGEQSDLFTTHLHLNGERLRAAFVLKGPSKFHKMEIKDLGKNGDQIPRLFDEPADIFFLQHCHHISTNVIKTMEAFANQANRPRKYCIINGIDTLRLFKAYKKIQ